MTLRFWGFRLEMSHTWTIARGVAAGGDKDAKVLFVELTDKDGVVGLGESAPSGRYRESAAGSVAFLESVDAGKLSFEDVVSSMEYLESVAPGEYAAKGALNIALLDGAARRAGQPIYDYLGLGFTEGKHVTSFSIGIDTPESIERKTREAERFPVIKLKLGGPSDRENLRALREAAPQKPVRVDGNEAWKTRDEALENIEWLAADGNIQFVEQPMPASATVEDLVWLKERSPLPTMGDESYVSAADLDLCAECYHAVNVKLVKAGGITGARDALQAARAAGLKTMIGCMIESSVLISAGAHLAELADYLDIDGNLLINNDPYEGATAENGIISFAGAAEPFGLRVRQRAT